MTWKGNCRLFVKLREVVPEAHDLESLVVA